MMIRNAILFIAALALAAPAARAEEADSLGTFGDWTAYSYTTKDGPVCFISSIPKKMEPEGAKRGPVHFLVTHRPKLNVNSEVSSIIGYNFKADVPATLAVDDQSFSLTTSGDGAWAVSAADDRKIVASMKKGSEMVVKGTSWRGTNTTDTYSLKGVSAAMDKIDAACKG